MMKLISKLVLFVGTFIALTVPAFAVDVISPVCDNVNGNDVPAACTDNTAAQNKGDELIFGNNGIGARIVNILSFIVGAAAVVVIMIAGVRFITSNGDSGTVAEARMAIIGAVIGLIVVSLAQVAVRFVLTNV